MKLSKGLCAPLVRLIHLELVMVGKIPHRAVSACISGELELLVMSLHLALQGQSRCLSLILIKLIQFQQLVWQLHLFFKF